MTEDLSIRPIPIRYASDLKELKTFLEEQGLRFEENIETAYGVFDREDRLVGCGCGEGSVLKCFAIAKELRGQNALGPLLSALDEFGY